MYQYRGWSVVYKKYILMYNGLTRKSTGTG